MEDAPSGPPRRIRTTGHLICALIAHAPWAWPLARGPVSRYFGRLADGWDSRTGSGGATHLAPLAAATLNVSPAPERVLDIGCGTGSGTLFLSREVPQARVRGVDLSERMIAKAVAKIGLDPEGRVAFRTGDASSLPYPEDHFDLVAQLNMPVFFAEIARVLRPGGHVVIASTSGAMTPFHTPDRTLRWRFAQRGIEPVASGEAGNGTYFLGRMAIPEGAGSR